MTTTNANTTEHSLGWLLTATNKHGAALELFTQNGTIYLAACENPVNRSGYRSPSKPLTVLSEWPALRNRIITDSCAGWRHEESDLSTSLVAATQRT